MSTRRTKQRRLSAVFGRRSARPVGPGLLHIYWVPAIANLAAPTVAELNAGIYLTY